MKTIKKYFWNIGISIDQFANAITGGDPDETISSRLGKCKENGSWICTKICKVLTKIWNFFGANQDGHCIESIERDEGADQIWKNRDGN
jgi:hypothetical protein